MTGAILLNILIFSYTHFQKDEFTKYGDNGSTDLSMCLLETLFFQ